MVTQTTDRGLESDIALHLYVRSLAVTGAQSPQEAVITRLERLEERGVVDEFSVNVWGKRISPDTTSSHTSAGKVILEHIDAFRAWADRNDMSLDSFFSTESVSTMVTGESCSRITFPTMTLAEYEGDTLQFVAPCTDGEERYTVTELLDSLDRETSGNA